MCLFKEHIIDDESDLNSLQCQIGNLVFSHYHHLPSWGKADNQLPFSAKIISNCRYTVKFCLAARFNSNSIKIFIKIKKSAPFGAVIFFGINFQCEKFF